MCNICPVVKKSFLHLFLWLFFCNNQVFTRFCVFFSDYSFVISKSPSNLFILWFYWFVLLSIFEQRFVGYLASSCTGNENVKFCCITGKCFDYVILYVKYLEVNVSFLLKKSIFFVKILYRIPKSDLNLDLWALWWYLTKWRER